MKCKLKINKSELWVEIDIAKVAGLTMLYDFDGVCHYTEALSRTAMDVWDCSVWGVPLPTVVFLSRILWCFSTLEHLCCYWRLSLPTFVEFCCCALYLLQLAHHIHCVSKWSSTHLNRTACVKNWHVISFFYSWNRTFCRVVLNVLTRRPLSCQHWLSSVSVVPQIKEQKNVLSFMNASFVILWGFKIRIFQCSW